MGINRLYRNFWYGMLLSMPVAVIGLAGSGCSGKSQITEESVPEVEYQAGNVFMQEAIKEARDGIHAHHGGPFGSVIVRDGNIIARGHNRVLLNNDPTCHGEMEAIRNACAALNTYDLSDCELYTTGEPCPMCLCACMWANIKTVFYGCTIDDNAAIGFRDARFDDVMGGREKLDDYLIEVDRDACLQLFEEYNRLPDKETY